MGRLAEYINLPAGTGTEARKLFEQAIQLDPAYASAYAALAWTRLNAAYSGWTEFWEEALQQAESLAQKAIKLDDGNAEAHRVLGSIYLQRVQFDLAIGENDRAIALNPSDAVSYAARGSLLEYAGHPKEAIVDFEIAMRLNPSMGSGRMEPVGWAYYLDHRYGDAVRVLEAGRRTSPDDYFIYAGLAASYAQLGRKDEAARAVVDVRRVWPFFKVDDFVAQFQGEADRALIAEGLRKAGLH